MSSSRDAARGVELLTSPLRSMQTREPPPLTRSVGEGVAETPSLSPRGGESPDTDDEVVKSLARDPEEYADLQHELSLQARSREELQTSAHATIRTELESVKLAEQRAAISSCDGCHLGSTE